MMTNKIRPLGTKVLVKLEEQKEKEGSIYIPPTARDNLQKTQAKVVAKGTKVTVEIKEGDTVIVPAYGGLVLGEDKNYRLFLEEEIMAVVG